MDGGKKKRRGGRSLEVSSFIQDVVAWASPIPAGHARARWVLRWGVRVEGAQQRKKGVNGDRGGRGTWDLAVGPGRACLGWMGTAVPQVPGRGGRGIFWGGQQGLCEWAYSIFAASYHDALIIRYNIIITMYGERSTTKKKQVRILLGIPSPSHSARRGEAPYQILAGCHGWLLRT